MGRACFAGFDRSRVARSADRRELTGDGARWAFPRDGRREGRGASGDMRGLGLTRLNRTRILPDTPQTRGMIAKVAHLIEWQAASE